MTVQPRPEWAVRLECERESRGWGKAALARRLLANVGITDPGPDKIRNMARQIRGWEKGDHFPRDWAPTYAAVFKIDQDQLFPANSDESKGHSPGTVDQGPTPDEGDDAVKRRAALQLLAAFGAGTAVPPGVLEQVLSGVEEALGNPLDIDEWERVVDEHARRIARQPAGALVPELAPDIIAVGELLKKGLSAAERTGLLRVSGGLSALLAIDLGDVGDKRAARVSWTTTKRIADASGDRDLRVWVRGRAAEEACWAERPSKVISDLTTEAVEIADGSPSPGLVRAHAARAYLAAARGDRSQADSALSDLHRTFGKLTPSANAPSPFTFRESHLRWAETYVHAMLGDDRGTTTLDRALALYTPTSFRAVLNLELMRAAMLVKDRDIDTGLQHAVTIIERWPHEKSAGRRVLSNQILRTLPEKARTLPAARELHALAV
ncbi:XRE family transcriptional regulator [Actinomadura viridis]|uniref:XRE family transcriptional regulator n=1 Tax=Actinomadura viridis TaxID=58110 RepID=UPI003691F103